MSQKDYIDACPCHEKHLNSQSLLTVQLSNFELNINALTSRESTEMVKEVHETSVEKYWQKEKNRQAMNWQATSVCGFIGKLQLL